MLVEENTGDGSEEWRDWNFYDNVIVIPTVSGLTPLYNQFTYSGRVSYDATLVGDEDPNPDFKLLDAYPSPFVIGGETSIMRIPYSLNKRYSKIQLGIWIYDASGVPVAEIPTTAIPSSSPGLHRSGATWSGKNDKGEYVASGVYIIHMEAEGESSTSKFVVVNKYR
jgi:flagellar hook assembly protein FlgD